MTPLLTTNSTSQPPVLSTETGTEVEVVSPSSFTTQFLIRCSCIINILDSWCSSSPWTTVTFSVLSYIDLRLLIRLSYPISRTPWMHSPPTKVTQWSFWETLILTLPPVPTTPSHIPSGQNMDLPRSSHQPGPCNPLQQSFIMSVFPNI